MDVMYFTWLDSPVDVDMNMEMPQFVLQETILYDCSQNYTAGTITVSHYYAADALISLNAAVILVVAQQPRGPNVYLMLVQHQTAIGSNIGSISCVFWDATSKPETLTHYCFTMLAEHPNNNVSSVNVFLNVVNIKPLLYPENKRR